MIRETFAKFFLTATVYIFTIGMSSTYQSLLSFGQGLVDVQLIACRHH